MCLRTEWRNGHLLRTVEEKQEVIARYVYGVSTKQQAEQIPVFNFPAPP